MGTPTYELAETRPTSEIRGNLAGVVDEAQTNPGRIVRFGRHRKPQVALMSEATLQSIFDRMRELEDDLLAAQANRVLALGGPDVPAELVEDGYVPPTPEDAARARERFRVAHAEA